MAAARKGEYSDGWASWQNGPRRRGERSSVRRHGVPADDPDRHLVELIQKGDERAWSEVISRYQGRLVAFARRMLAQRSDAEDLVQETFLGLVRSLANYDQSRSLETYLFAILRNKLSDQFRRLGKGQRKSLDQLDLDQADSAWVTQDTPSHSLVRDEARQRQRAALVRCLRQWAEHCTETRRFQDLIVAEMLLVLGLRNKEAASDLELSETAVAGLKFRIVERWRQMLDASGEARPSPDWDLPQASTIAAIWRDEGISCPKRSTLGRYLLGALDDEWNTFIAFHAVESGCVRCLANLDDLRDEDEGGAAASDALRERCFASSIGLLSRRPE